jgi:DNA-binding PadR family transcriptional regulator
VEGIALQGITLTDRSVARASKKIEERIVKKTLDLIILRALKENTMNGYSIILFVNRKFGVRLSAGTVYSLLYSLDRKGFIEARPGKGAKCYALSKKGEVTLRAIKEMQTRIRTLNGNIF